MRNNDSSSKNTNILDDLIFSIYKNKDKELLENYIEKKYKIMIHVNSKHFGITSIIKDYEYKTGKRKGNKIKAHYTLNDKFLETINDNKNNTEPIYYNGYFSLDKVREFYEVYFPEECPKTLSGFYRLK